MRTRTAAAALVLSLGLPVLPLTAARAGADPGSGFGSVSLSATARGQEFLFRAEIPGQLSVPYAQSELRFGEGSSTATVAWPGATAATLGTAVVLLGAPEQAIILNDPVVAYARSGSGSPDVSNTTLTGSTMRATATQQKATAVASVEGAKALTAAVGRTSSETSVELAGPTRATGTATSIVRDVSLAGGLVTVAAVVSTTTGKTDGLVASATGSTVVSGVTVAGLPVTVDQQGVSVAGTSVVPAGAADAVADALSQAQISLVLTTPVKRVQGGDVEYATSALVVVTPLGTLTIGGAQLALQATVGDEPFPSPAPPVPTGGGDPSAGQQPPGPGTGPGTVGNPPPVGGTEPPQTAGGPLALLPVAIRTGYGWVWLVSGLLLSLLATSGLLSLNRRWLAPDPACPLERRSL